MKYIFEAFFIDTLQPLTSIATKTEKKTGEFPLVITLLMSANFRDLFESVSLKTALTLCAGTSDIDVCRTFCLYVQVLN